MTDGKHFFILHSIQTKILIITLALAAGTTLVSLLISYYTEINTIKNTTESYMTQYIAFADERFNDMLSEVRKTALSVATEQEIIWPGILHGKESASYEEYLRKKRITSFLSGLMSQKQYMDNVMVITEDRRIFQADTELVLKRDLETSVMQAALQTDRAGIFYDRQAQEVYYSCPILHGGDIVAVNLIKLNYDELIAAYEQEPLKEVDIYVFDSGQGLFYTNAELTGKEGELLQKIERKDSGDGYVEWNGKRWYALSWQHGTEKMTTVGLIPYEVLLRDANALRQKLLLVGACAVLLAVVASVYLSGRLCTNLKMLTENMEEIRTGNLMVRSNIHSADEVGKLSETFNEMMERIQMLLEEVKQKERLKREAEQSVLATQIEPHFLYNSIDSIQHVAHMRKEEEIEHVAEALSELLRSVLTDRNEFITLWEEREYIENYIYIERFKYRGDFQLLWDVDESLWTWRLPKLLLQPVVENALIHGISAKDSGGIIQVKIYCQDDCVIAKVMDNGKGMSEEKVEQLLSDIRKKDITGFRRVGLANVLNRIRLIYGDEYGGTVYSCQDMFTCVELRLPFKEIQGR